MELHFETRTSKVTIDWFLLKIRLGLLAGQIKDS